MLAFWRDFILKIINLKVNHMQNPLGFQMNSVSFQWETVESSGTQPVSNRLLISKCPDMAQPVYDSGETLLDSIGTVVSADWDFSTRYYWVVSVTDDTGGIAVSETAWFETPKGGDWSAQWIAPTAEGDNGLVFTNFQVEKPVVKARLSITGVGLYEAYLNGQKIGNEYLTPNFNDYDTFIQFQTYETESYLTNGRNTLEIWLGDGWYKGRYMVMGPGPDRNKYGDRQATLAELILTYEDGSTETIKTDASWLSRKSPVVSAGIYDGEHLDDTVDGSDACPVEVLDLGYDRLEARRSLPVTAKLTRKPVEILRTPKGETVLDFGQNMAGWVRFYNRLPAGAACRYVAGEILQDGCFYHENMRTAKTEFAYTSDGKEKWVRPHFTWYGFRYLLLEGFPASIQLSDFEVDVLYSDMEQTGFITTGNEKVNQLISNVLWGQRSNYIDVPTDCPQRDERLGWTGDTQIFSMTAAYNMNVAGFFRKFMYDLQCEQNKRGGRVPFVVPAVCFNNQVSAAWSDAATVVPWNLYQMYGDKELLREQYAGMKAWTDYIISQDEASGGTRLYTTDNHFGDWLALDAPPEIPTGGTDMVLIATAYYYLSACLTAQAATVLGKAEDSKRYQVLADEIKASFQREYLTENGNLTQHTQTAYALTLYTGLYRDGQGQLLADGLERAIQENGGYLNTGFVGTPCLCPVLTRFGKGKLAYQLLLNEEYPSWLYAVNLGATTIWERWNSVLPDGHINPEGMNSLNHYAYGSILEWIYRYAAGMEPGQAGWKTIRLHPVPDVRLGYINASYHSVSGVVKSAWRYQEDGTIAYSFEIPFGVTAELTLPAEETVTLRPGTHTFTRPVISERVTYSGDTELAVLLQDDAAKAIIAQYAPGLAMIPPQFAQGTLRSVMLFPFSEYNRLTFDQIVEKLVACQTKNKKEEKVC